MFTKLLRHHSKSRAQAMIEFAIVLPILIMVLIGIFEVGRLIFVYAAITNASREAARFGSALGYDDNGFHKYKDCNGILQMAQRSSLLPLTLNRTDRNNPPPNSVTITYDGSSSGWCTQPSGEDGAIFVSSGDRVIITVTYQYAPYTHLVPFPSRTYTAKSARTILGYIALDGSGGSNPGGIGPGGSTNTPTPSGGGGSTSTPTATFPGLPTSTATATATATQTPVSVFTLTSIPSATITLLPSPTGTATATPTDTGTPTNTSTPSNTPTPTNTATAKPGCGNITASVFASSTNTLYMTFTNPYSSLTVLNVQVKWNVTQGQTTWTLQSATLGSLFWNGTNTSGNFTITPATTLTIPGNNTTSSIIFTFDSNYSKKNTDSITINLSGSCAGFKITDH